MATINENIRQLLEMLDHPEAYTEQEIHDIRCRLAAVQSKTPAKAARSRLDEDSRLIYRFADCIRHRFCRHPHRAATRWTGYANSAAGDTD